MAFDQGGPQFGLSDCKIATWSSAGTYGTVTDVMSVQLVGVTLRYTEAVLVGDDSETATAARAIGGTCTLRFGSISTTALAIILGRATSTISSVVQQSVKGGNRMPYFGLVGKALAEEAGGDFWIYVPKMKISGDLNIAMLEYGAFSIPEVSARMVDDSSYGILNLITHPTDVAITVMPPANIAVVSS